MKYDVELLNVMKYEKEGKKGTRIAYRMLDPKLKQNSDKFKGYTELSAYFDGHEVFDKVDLSMLGVQCTLTVKEEPYPNNPLKKRTVIEKINDISLL